MDGEDWKSDANSDNPNLRTNNAVTNAGNDARHTARTKSDRIGDRAERSGEEGVGGGGDNNNGRGRRGHGGGREGRGGGATTGRSRSERNPGSAASPRLLSRHRSHGSGGGGGSFSGPLRFLRRGLSLSSTDGEARGSDGGGGEGAGGGVGAGTPRFGSHFPHFQFPHSHSHHHQHHHHHHHKEGLEFDLPLVKNGLQRGRIRGRCILVMGSSISSGFRHGGSIGGGIGGASGVGGIGGGVGGDNFRGVTRGGSIRRVIMGKGKAKSSSKLRPKKQSLRRHGGVGGGGTVTFGQTEAGVGVAGGKSGVRGVEEEGMGEYRRQIRKSASARPAVFRETDDEEEEEEDGEEADGAGADDSGGCNVS